jgi:hypothetical protein
MQPHLPQPRGPISECLCKLLPQRPGTLPQLVGSDPLAEEDLQLALHICYGLHYDGFERVSEEWEWSPGLLKLRQRLEQVFLQRLLKESLIRGVSPGGQVEISKLSEQLQNLLNSECGPSLSTFLCETGDKEALSEFVIHRSIYHRKEADPHTWAIPRVRGRAKSALVHLQTDEYGAGKPGRSHAELFAETMASLDLDPTPGAYIDQVPGVTLATDNLVSFFGLHRRWRGALVGHLAAFEMTSVAPMTRYAFALRRILSDEVGAEFYDVHVDADVAHGQIAATELVVGLAESDEVATADMLFGAASLLALERQFANHLLDSWASGSSSLYSAPSVESLSLLTYREVLCLEDLRLVQNSLVARVG